MRCRQWLRCFEQVGNLRVLTSLVGPSLAARIQRRMPLSFTSTALMPMIAAVAALPVDPLAKFIGTDAAPTYKQCYWDRSHGWDNPNACYVEGEVLPLPYPNGFRTAFEYDAGAGFTSVGYNGDLVATIMDDCQKTGLRKCEKTHQFERGNKCFWDSSGGRDGKPPNACYVPLDPLITYAPEGWNKHEHGAWHQDANMDDCRGAYRETGGATGSACTHVKAWLKENGAKSDQ